MDLSPALSGDATITDENGNSTSVAVTGKKGSVSVPLPVIGMRAGWVVAPNVYLERAGRRYFKAKITGFDGRVTDLRASAT